ncbi:hypothetical protein D9M71_774850 [compost metagenome]
MRMFILFEFMNFISFLVHSMQGDFEIFMVMKGAFLLNFCKSSISPYTLVAVNSSQAAMKLSSAWFPLLDSEFIL